MEEAVATSLTMLVAFLALGVYGWYLDWKQEDRRRRRDRQRRIRQWRTFNGGGAE